MFPPFLLLLVLFLHLPSSGTAVTTGKFIVPADSSNRNANTDPQKYDVYKVGSILEVSWTTNSTEDAVYDLVINQDGSPDTQIDRPPNAEFLTKTSYSWRITTDGSDGGSVFDLTFSNQFNFILYKRDETSYLTSSVYFNITNSTINQYGQRIQTSSTLSTTSTTSSTSTATSTSTTTFSAAPLTSASPPPKAENTGLSSQATIGLGVGVGLAAAALIATAAFWYFYVRRKRIEKRNLLNAAMEPYNHVEPTSAHHNWAPPAELHAQPRDKWLAPTELQARPTSQKEVVRSELYG